MNTKSNATLKKENAENLPKSVGAEKVKNDPQPSATLPKQEKEEREIISLLNPTPQQRILAAKNFSLLTERYERLKGKQDELNAFRLSNDGTHQKVRLSNASGFSFETSATDVIGDVVDVIQERINNRLEAVSEEILKFNI